jgi:hypothetical protein
MSSCGDVAGMLSVFGIELEFEMNRFICVALMAVMAVACCMMPQVSAVDVDPCDDYQRLINNLNFAINNERPVAEAAFVEWLRGIAVQQSFQEGIELEWMKANPDYEVLDRYYAAWSAAEEYVNQQRTLWEASAFKIRCYQGLLEEYTAARNALPC